jgi:thioesterase domain-containing protein/acyl carrier protein
VDQIPKGPTGKIQRLNLADRIIPKHAAKLTLPASAIETELIKIWGELLGVKTPGTHENFFALGGDSITGVRLVSCLEERFGKRLPVAVLLEAPTIASLAQVLESGAWSGRSTFVIPLQPNGVHPPFFCIHPGGGGVLYYRDLAKCIGEDQPFFGIQAEGLDGTIKWRRIEEIAARYIEEIQQIQPNGPYFLGGLCFGGITAFEMAQQFLAKGEYVALLALLDTYAPGYDRYLPNNRSLQNRLYRVMQRLDLEIGNIRVLGRKEKASYLVWRGKRALGLVARRVRWKAGNLLERSGYVLPDRFQELQQAHFEATQRYMPKAYPGSVTLFRASKQPAGCRSDPLLGWKPLVTGRIEVCEVPGYHDSIATGPRAKFLAQQLREYLERARERASASEARLTEYAMSGER